METERIDLEIYLRAIAERVYEEKREGVPPSEDALANDHRRL